MYAKVHIIKADQVMIRLASGRAEAKQKENKRWMTAGRQGFDGRLMPSNRIPALHAAGSNGCNAPTKPFPHFSTDQTIIVRYYRKINFQALNG
jgi:hypothetical protein